MLRPLNDYVVLEKVKEEEKTQSGIILTQKAKDEPSHGVVIAVGPGKTEDGKLTVKAGLTELGGGEVELTVDYRKIGEKTAQVAKSTFEWIDSKMPWNW